MSINHQQQQQIRTPHRKMDQHQPRQQNPCHTFTPCTRLSRMTIESCSNGGQQGRIRTAHFQQLPVSNFNDKLMQVVREEQQQASQEEQSTHPNLNMFLGADSRISFFKEKDIFNSFATDDELEEEEEESDEGGDLFFSSNLCPMSSPERSTLTRQSIFEDDDETVPISVNKRAIFDDEDEEEEEEEAEEQDEDMEQDVYDPSTAWLSQIYSDVITDDNDAVQAITTTTTPPTTTEEQAEQEQEEENRAPRYWHNRQKEMNEKTLKLKRTILPQEEDNNLLSTNTRLPLREIRFEQELTSDDEGSLPTTKKKMILGQGGKSHKMRFMRSLSPPRFTTKRKGVSSSSSSGSSSSGSSLL